MNKRYVNECVKKSKPYIPGKPLDVFLKEKELQKCIKLDANENPLGFSPIVKIALEKIEFNRYPDGGTTELKEYLSNGLKVSPDNIVITPGSNHIIELINRAFLQNGHKVITGKNTFSLYKISTERNGGKIIEKPLVSGKFNLKAMASEISDETDIIFICNPNNPTGVLIPRDELIEFINQIPERILIVVDEAYIDFCDEYATVIDLVRKKNNLIIMRTFSKIYGLAGFRIGYAVSSKGIIEILSRLVIPFSVSLPALIAAKAALDDVDFVERSYRHVYIERKRLETFFKSLNWFCYSSQANFIYVEIPIEDIQKQLEDKGILIRNLESFGFGQNSFRITIGSIEENSKFIAAIQEIIENN